MFRGQYEVNQVLFHFYYQVQLLSQLKHCIGRGISKKAFMKETAKAYTK